MNGDLVEVTNYHNLMLGKGQISLDRSRISPERENMKHSLRASVVIVHNEKLLGFRGVDPSSAKEYFFIPGGKIENHETPPQCATREAFEETGYRVEIDPDSCIDLDYEFQWDGEVIFCTTLFYRGKLLSPFPSPVDVKGQEYNKGVQWIPVSDIDAALSYSSEISEAVRKLL